MNWSTCLSPTVSNTDAHFDLWGASFSPQLFFSLNKHTKSLDWSKLCLEKYLMPPFCPPDFHLYCALPSFILFQEFDPSCLFLTHGSYFILSIASISFVIQGSLLPKPLPFTDRNMQNLNSCYFSLKTSHLPDVPCLQTIYGNQLSKTLSTKLQP